MEIRFELNRNLATKALTCLVLLVCHYSQLHAQGTSAAYVHVACGGDNTFAIQSNGTLWGWGYNSDGELGDGTTISRLRPVALAEPTGVAPGSRWVRIYAHGPTTPVYGLRSDQTLWRWGANQLTPVQTPLTATLPSGATLVDLSISAQHFLALYSDGSLYSWGVNTKGQLGIGTATGTTTITSPTLVIIPATAAPGTRWTSIRAEYSESFAVRSDGTLWSWGGAATINPSVLGHPMLITGCFTPELVQHPAAASPGTGWVSVAVGETHTLGLRTDGTLWVWGSSQYGALGQGVTVQGAPSPLLIPLPAGRPAGTTWQRVKAGSHTCQGILSDGTLWAWGSNSFGQLGINGNNTTEFTPQQEYNEEVWTESVLGVNHAAAISHGQVYVTGNGGGYGALGLGNGTTRISFFVRVIGLPLAAQASAISLSVGHVFPNPVNAGENLSFDSSIPQQSTRAEFADSRGQLVMTTAIDKKQLTVPLLPAGIYLVRFYDHEHFVASSKLGVN